MAERHDINDGKTDLFNGLVRAVILIIVSLLVSVLSVSFAMHHMRLQYEEEFKAISHDKIYQVSDMVKMVVDGNELKGDPAEAAVKYINIFELMLADTTSETLSNEKYALFSYLNGQLTLIAGSGSEASEFTVASADISDWLTGTFAPQVMTDDNSESVLVPITDDTGMCIGVFEYKCSFEGLDEVGNQLEGKKMIAASTEGH